MKQMKLELFEDYKKNKAHNEAPTLQKFAEFVSEIDGQNFDNLSGQKVVGFHDFVRTLSPIVEKTKKEKKSKYKTPPVYDGGDSDGDLDFLNDGPDFDPNSPEIRGRLIKLGGVPVV